MKSKAELREFVDKIVEADSPVGMDAVYVHAIILEKLEQIDRRLEKLEATIAESQTESQNKDG